MQNVQSVWPPCWALFTLVEPCSVKFDHDQTFHWTNVEGLIISFLFRHIECCSVRLTSHWTFVQFARAQLVIVSEKLSLVQQNVQHVWPPSNWTSLNNTQLCWTNVQCCSVKMFSTFDRGLIIVASVKIWFQSVKWNLFFHVTTPNECRHCNYPRIIKGWNEAHNDLDKNNWLTTRE